LQTPGQILIAADPIPPVPVVEEPWIVKGEEVPLGLIVGTFPVIDAGAQAQERGQPGLREDIQLRQADSSRVTPRRRSTTTAVEYK
jgi:hypothetical protein